MRLISAESGVQVPAPPSVSCYAIVIFVTSIAFLSQIRSCIDTYALLSLGARVIVAVSGGPDSMALLTALYRLRHQYALTLIVAHVNHQLRGAEAERDDMFVERQASHLGLSFFRTRVDVRALQRSAGLSPQHAARHLRYAFFYALQQEVNAAYIALGHTADDQAETLLIRLLRGGGSSAMAGIPVKRPPYIRPLLTSSRDDVMRFLEAESIPWVVDRSNLQQRYLRNRLRSELLPVLKQYNPRVVARLNELAEMMRADNAVLEEQVEHLSKEVLQWKSQGRAVLELTLYQAAPLALQRRLLRRLINILHPFPDIVGFRHIEALRQFVLTGSTGKRLTLPGGIIAEHQAHVVYIWHIPRAALPSEVYLLPLPGEACIPALKLRVLGDIVELKPSVLKAGVHCAYLDGDRIAESLSVRFFRPGDRFYPLGAPGHKKLKDFFIAQKIPRAERPYVPLVVNGEYIVLVVGHRIDEAYKVRPETQRVIRLQCEVCQAASSG